MNVTRARLGVVVAVLVCVIPAGAQTPGYVRVLRTAAVVERPAGDANVVGTVNVGEVLEVLDERDSWVLVRPPGGNTPGWRTGWVNRGSVGAMPDRTTSDSAPRGSGQGGAVQVVPDAQRPSAMRRGFIIGFGAGGGLHRTPTFTRFDRFGRVVSTGGGEHKPAVVTDFGIGYAPSDKLLLYYSNKVAFTTDDLVDVVGVSGFGATYMFRGTSPTPFVSGSLGAGVVGTFIETVEAETGAGFSVGGGWEFARHYSLAADAIVVRLDNGQSHAAYRLLFHILFY